MKLLPKPPLTWTEEWTPTSEGRCLHLKLHPSKQHLNSLEQSLSRVQRTSNAPGNDAHFCKLKLYSRYDVHFLYRNVLNLVLGQFPMDSDDENKVEDWNTRPSSSRLRLGRGSDAQKSKVCLFRKLHLLPYTLFFL